MNTILTVRALAGRMGFDVIRVKGGYYVVDEVDNPGTKATARDGTPLHKTVAEVFETLTERV